jgi:hypothetical protein
MVALDARRAPVLVAPPKMPTKKTSTSTIRSGPASMSKATFIHSLLPSIPVNEVVARARAQGLDITQGYVRWVRWQSRSAAKKRAPKAPASPTKPSAPSAPVAAKVHGTPSKAESLLKALGAELGWGRALEILAGERARVKAVIGLG